MNPRRIFHLALVAFLFVLASSPLAVAGDADSPIGTAGDADDVMASESLVTPTTLEVSKVTALPQEASERYRMFLSLFVFRVL